MKQKYISLVENQRQYQVKPIMSAFVFLKYEHESLVSTVNVAVIKHSIDLYFSRPLVLFCLMEISRINQITIQENPPMH